MKPLALGWIDHDNSTAPDEEAAQVGQLARRLGYALRWANPHSLLGLAEQVEAGAAEALLLPSTAHIDTRTLHRTTAVIDVECASPRTSFPRHTLLGGLHR